MKKEIATQEAPQAIGPYSQGVMASGGKWIFVSGQLPIDPATGEIVKADITHQTTRALKNVQAVLAEARVGLTHVVKTTVFLKNMEDFAGMNKVYAEFFQAPFPARAAVEVARLPKDVLVEIECIAVSK